ncbi:MAG: molybdopterin-dependent oxidoreductase [Gemmatimonadota bacterium]
MCTRTVHSTCYMCTEDCPITVVTEGENILSIDHPDCVRAEGMLEQRESSLRWVNARIRSTPRETWRIVPRAEAVSVAGSELTRLQGRHGPEAVAFVVGFTKEVRPYLQRFAHCFGSPHYLTESSCCFGSCFVAAALTLGKEYDYFLGPSRSPSPATRCRLVWSANPSESRLPYQRHHLLLDAPEVPTIVVDPRRTPLAEGAEIHLQPRPGTDGALALGMAHVIFRDGLEDQDFLGRFAHGAEAFRNYVSGFTPGETARITGIPAETIEAASTLYARSRPAQVTISPCATTHHSNGFQNHRAILLLPAICGNLDVEGGNRPWGHRLIESSVDLPPAEVSSLGPAVGSNDHPVFAAHYGEGQGMRLAESIEAGEIRAVFSVGMNLMMWPNSRRLRNALGSLEFFSACDFFESPTTDLATVFFPAATHLEREALVVSGTGRIQHRRPVVQPRGDAIGDSELVFDLARAMGMDDSFWNGGLRQSFQRRLEGAGFSLADLPEDGGPLELPMEAPPERSYLATGFGTPTGKVEFVSTILEKAGHDGLPIYQEPYWSPVSAPELARSYPLVLTSGARTRNYTHSQGRQLEVLRNREPEPLLEIHPLDAADRRIKNGDPVSLSSPLGKITMRATVTDSLAPGVVSAPHGWAEADVNQLIPDAGLDPISGFPPFKSSLCQVKRLTQAPRQRGRDWKVV